MTVVEAVNSQQSYGCRGHDFDDFDEARFGDGTACTPRTACPGETLQAHQALHCLAPLRCAMRL